MEFARRLALIPPEPLVATKRALARGADAAGFRNAIEVGKTFDEIRERDGLGAARRWRAAQFVE